MVANTGNFAQICSKLKLSRLGIFTSIGSAGDKAGYGEVMTDLSGLSESLYPFLSTKWERSPPEISFEKVGWMWRLMSSLFGSILLRLESWVLFYFTFFFKFLVKNPPPMALLLLRDPWLLFCLIVYLSTFDSVCDSSSCNFLFLFLVIIFGWITEKENRI